MITDHPVRYGTGENFLSVSELSSKGQSGWKHGRSIVSRTGYMESSLGGGWRATGIMSLVSESGLIKVISGNTAGRIFTDNGNNTYTNTRFYKEQLTYDGLSHRLILLDTEGSRWEFNDFSANHAAGRRGKLALYGPPAGGNYSLTYGSSGASQDKLVQVYAVLSSGGNAYEETWTYDYYLSGNPFGQLQKVTLSRSVNGGAATTVRKVEYTYYSSSGSNGPANSLQWAKISDGSGNLLDVYYHRYNVALADGQLPIRYLLGATGYERAKASLGSESAIDSANDATLAQWALYYFEYDTQGRVTKEVVQGKGCGCGSGGGKGIYTFSYTDATHSQPEGPNTWRRKTIETLPDGNQNIVYTSGYGGTMLRIFKEVSSGAEWKTYTRFDASGRVALQAMPSAVTGYSEGYADLVSYSEGTQSSPYISDSTGLVHVFEYWTSTDIPNGLVAGYQSNKRLKQGDGGTAILQETTKYTQRTAGSISTYPVASMTKYRNTDGTGPQTTSFSYSYHTSAHRVLERVTTNPKVTIAQNGSDSATTTTARFDGHGRLEWARDEDGFIRYMEYDPKSGSETKQIVDVNTATVSNEPPGWTTPSGGGLHLTTQYRVDALGRTTKLTDPNGNVTYKVYADAAHEVRVYPGWTGTATTGPTRVTREDRVGSYQESLTMSATPATSGGEPTGAEAVANIQSLERWQLDTGDRVLHQDSYFSFSGLSYSTAPSLGTQGTHFYRQSLGYDVRGQLARLADRSGTVSRAVYDALGRVSSFWIGTDDVPTTGDWSPTNTAGTNLVKANASEYDAGGVGDGNLTKRLMFVSPSSSLDTAHKYDFRNRLTDTRGPDKVAHRATYDNLDQATIAETYADADTDFVIDSGELRGKAETKFDEKSQVYQVVQHNVDPSTGAIGNRLTENRWFSARGLPIKTRNPNGLFRKNVFDGAARATTAFTSYQDAETAYADADDVTGDVVITESILGLQNDGQVIQTTTYERTDDATVTGPLSTTWNETNSRRTYTAAWYDLVNRMTSAVDYGRNNGAVLSRPGTAPAPNTSDLYIVNMFEYDAVGRPYRRTDNKGRIQERIFDLLGRLTRAIENRVDGAASETELDTDRIVEFVYDASGRRSQLVAKNPKGAGQGVQNQTTTYVYGTDANEATPAVWRNDLLVAILQADSDDSYNPAGAAGAKLGNGVDATYDRVEYTYDYASRRATAKDPRGVVLTAAYDAAGRAFSEAASGLPSDVDGAVKRLETSFDDLSRRQKLTSYDAASAGNVVNEVKLSYDGWGNELKCEQAHVGAVTGGTPAFQKTFADGAESGEAKYVRLSSTAYPNGRAVHRNYPTAAPTGDRLSRVDNVANDASGTLKFAQYTYLGLNSVVLIAHPQVSNGLNYDLGTGTGNPQGWDNFGRIDDNRWKKNNNTIFDRYEYGYDRTSARKWRDNLQTTVKDEFYVIDGLDRVSTEKRGNLNAGRTDITGTPVFQEAFTLEATGNWRALVQTTSGTQTLNQTRAHNAANEVGTIGSTVGVNWLDPTHDAVGNSTQIPQAGAEGTRQHLTYDAWNRLVKVRADSGGAPGGTIAEYQFDALHRRAAKLKPNGANWDRRDYYYSCEWQVVEERELLNTASKTTAATTPKFQWVWDLRYIDAAVLRDENKDGDGDCVDGTDQRLYCVQDANINTTALINTAGTVVERYLYEAYGKVSVFNASWAAQSPATFSNEVLYGGYRLNSETGLYLSRHRDYHPTLGRWLQRDPFITGTRDLVSMGSLRVMAGGPAAAKPAAPPQPVLTLSERIHAYAYVSSNPLIQTDPSGGCGAKVEEKECRTCSMTLDTPGTKTSYGATDVGPTAVVEWDLEASIDEGSKTVKDIDAAGGTMRGTTSPNKDPRDPDTFGNFRRTELGGTENFMITLSAPRPAKVITGRLATGQFGNTQLRTMSGIAADAGRPAWWELEARIICTYSDNKTRRASDKVGFIE